MERLHGLGAVLDAHGVSHRSLFGQGGEASVYALDEARVLRVLHDGGTLATLRRRAELVDELRHDALPFTLPELLDAGEIGGRAYAVERRLPGRAVAEALADLDGPDRARLVEAHLDAAAELHRVALQPRPWFGDLLADPPVRSDTWSGYLRDRARHSFDRAPQAFARVDPIALADALPDSATGAFIHLDAFVGNMLAVGTTISAVIDIGTTSAVGDPCLDAVLAVVYLHAPSITPTATASDRDVAASWLRNRALADRYEPTRRWVAAYWSWAVDDGDLHSWCREVLLDG